MNITLSATGAKKFVRALLIAGNLFAFGAACHYVYWQYTSRVFFQVLTFDLNSRLPEIRKAYAEAQRTTTTVPTSTTSSTLEPLKIK